MNKGMVQETTLGCVFGTEKVSNLFIVPDFHHRHGAMMHGVKYTYHVEYYSISGASDCSGKNDEVALQAAEKDIGTGTQARQLVDSVRQIPRFERYRRTRVLVNFFQVRFCV